MFQVPKETFNIEVFDDFSSIASGFSKLDLDDESDDEDFLPKFNGFMAGRGRGRFTT